MDFANVGICYVDFAMPHCIFLNFNKIFTDLLILYSNKTQFYFQKKDSRNASKKMQKVSKKLAKRCKKLAEIEKIAMTPANSCHDLAQLAI